jgi:hypothetical protein
MKASKNEQKTVYENELKNVSRCLKNAKSFFKSINMLYKKLKRNVLKC